MNTIKYQGATVNYRDDKIIHIHYDSVLISLEEAKMLIKNVGEKSPWKVAPIYISAEPFANHEPEAQKFLTSDYVMSRSSAVAVLVISIAQKIGVNLFIKIRKPSKPTRFFTSEKEAINWLQQFETIDK